MIAPILRVDGNSAFLLLAAALLFFAALVATAAAAGLFYYATAYTGAIVLGIIAGYCYCGAGYYYCGAGCYYCGADYCALLPRLILLTPPAPELSCLDDGTLGTDILLLLADCGGSTGKELFYDESF